MINFVIIAILTFQTNTMYVQNVERDLAPDKIENENQAFYDFFKYDTASYESGIWMFKRSDLSFLVTNN